MDEIKKRLREMQNSLLRDDALVLGILHHYMRDCNFETVRKAAVAEALISEIRGDGYTFKRSFPRYAQTFFRGVTGEELEEIYRVASKARMLINRFKDHHDAIEHLKQEAPKATS